MHAILRSVEQTTDSELEELLADLKPSIKVVGCGGGGSNTIKRIWEEGIEGAELIAVNTDAQHLLNTKVPKKILIGRRITRGFGAGAIPQIGEDAANESIQHLRSTVDGSDMVFVTCGLGGGTGTGSSPIVASVARASGALTIGVVTLPFFFEGEQRRKNAVLGMEKLRKTTDTLITIPNDRLLELVPHLPVDDAFKVADEILMRAVKGIAELITKPGLINLDFADLKTILGSGGLAMIGLGEASGENRAIESVRRALSSPLLDVDISGGSAALINVTGGADMTLGEAQRIADEIYRQLDSNAKLIWGAQIDEEMEDKIRTLLVIVGVKSMQIFAPKESHGIDVIW